MTEGAKDNCPRCKGLGWYWLTPNGFNPFFEPGWSTARVAHKAICSCVLLKGGDA